MKRTGARRIIFITGTDTGVGETLLTRLLLHHLRQSGCHTLAMKLFCSDSRADAELLCAVQDDELPLDAINPVFFAEPFAPLVAARKHQCSIHVTEVLRQITRMANRYECSLIKGISGVIVPPGNGFTVLDLVAKLRSGAIVVSRNRLGTINYAMLTIGALQAGGIERLKIMLMSSPRADSSGASNSRMLSELLAPAPVCEMPFLERNPSWLEALKTSEKKLKKLLRRFWLKIFSPPRSL